MSAHRADSLRRIAQLLYRMTESKRELVFARFQDRDTEHLRAQMSELSMLEVSASRDASAAVFDLPTTSPEERINRLPADLVGVTLAMWPPSLIAVLIDARSWPWREQALGRIPGQRQADVRNLLSNGPSRVGPAVLRALCQQLLEDVAATMGSKSIPPRAVSIRQRISEGFSRVTAWML